METGSPMQSDPLNAGAGFVQDRFAVKYPVPQISCEQFEIGTHSVQFPLTKNLKKCSITFHSNFLNDFARLIL